MKIKAMLTKNMTIKKRLAVSNILMILVPVAITALIALMCIGVIWFSVTHSVGVGFQDSEDFYKASRSIAMIVEKALDDMSHTGRPEGLAKLSHMLDKGSMSLSVDSSGKNIYQYGLIADADKVLIEAANTLGGESFVSNGNRELYVKQSKVNGVVYRIEIFASPSKLSYRTLKITIALSIVILILAIFLSIVFTNRFLTKFVFQKIEDPLDILGNGVRQISDGNLKYRLEYKSQDEFTPICADFNEMAARLEASAEQLQQHEQSRKELLAGISHDLRSPLTSIRAYVEGLLDGVAKTPEAQRGYLEIIKNKAEDIDRMLAKLFLFSKMELGEYPDNPELLQLDDEVRQLVRALSAEYEENGLILSIGTLTPAIVWADPDQLRRVLTNIMENSLKYKTKAIGNLSISLLEENGGYLLSLCDDGPGVSQDALPHLFEVFYRSDPSRQNPNRGSGLGLAIAANAVHRMNGTIEAKSGENGGLKIVIWLPKVEERI